MRFSRSGIYNFLRFSRSEGLSRTRQEGGSIDGAGASFIGLLFDGGQQNKKRISSPGIVFFESDPLEERRVAEKHFDRDCAPGNAFKL